MDKDFTRETYYVLKKSKNGINGDGGKRDRFRQGKITQGDTDQEELRIRLGQVQQIKFVFDCSCTVWVNKDL